MSPKNNLFLYNISEEKGSYHPINKMKNFLVEILKSRGFKYMDGPEIETED